MIVSNQRAKTGAQHFLTWQHITAVLDRIMASPLRSAVLSARGALLGLYPFALPASESDILRREFVHDRVLLPPHEGSLVMFRRENQEESFDDDVAALRDKAGSSRRDPSDADTFARDDQTTYSPPRQTWSPVSTESAGDLEAQPQAMRPAPAAGDASVIAADTSWDGTVQSSGSLHIHGNVSGQIKANGEVFVAEGASVSAEVNAGSVTVAGSLEGTVECSGRFEVLPSGRVSADVAAPRLVVHEGALVVGKLRMTSAGETTG